MLDRQNNVLFVHVPKTGGQSVESVFLNLRGLRWEERAPLLMRPNKDRSLGPSHLAHLTAGEYVSCGHLTQDEFDTLYTFAFVRNPWERLVSGYNYRDRGQGTSFADFVRKSLAYTDTHPDKARHAMPQAEYICDSADNILVDFVGRFENIAEDFAIVADAIGLASRDLPHKNRSDASIALHKSPGQFLKKHATRLLKGVAPARKPHYSEYFAPDLTDLVGEFYQRDIALFGYEFEQADVPEPAQPQAMK